MSTNFPSGLDSTANLPTAADLADDNLDTKPHSTLHGDLGLAVLALETKVGVDSSAVTTSLDYKVANRQPLDADLTAIAALSTAAYGRSLLTAADAGAGRTLLGLGSAATSDVLDFDPIGSAAAAQAASQPLDSDLTALAGLTATTDNFIVSVASAWASRTPAQAKTSLALVKGDVGLGNVDNTSDATKNSASVTLTNKTLTAPVIATIVNTGTLTLPTSTDTLVGKATTDTLTNKSIDASQLTGSVAIARLPTGTGSSNVPLGGVVTGAGPTGDASHTLALTYNAAGQLTAVTNNAIAIAESAVTGLVADLALKAPLASPALTGTPTAPTQTAGDASTAIATDAFVTTAINNAISGLDVKPDVAYVSLAALPANTYANGASGVGATLTGNANGPLVIDGVTLVVGQAGERVLVAAESASANNGWYTITQVGVVAVSPYILTRATESDQAAEIGAGYLTGVVAPNTVVAGANNGKLYISVAADPFTVGTTALTFSQVGGTYAAGTGLTLSGSTFSITNAGPGATGPLGTATRTNAVTINAQGQVTAFTDQAIALAATGDVTGTLPGATTLVGTSNVESIIRANSLDQFAAAAANVNLNSNRIINVTDPSSAQDAMTLQYANTTYAPKASPTFTGTVTTAADLVIYNTAPATQTASYNLATLAASTAITNNGASINIRAVSISPTFSYTTAPGAGFGYQGIQSAPTHQNTAGGASRLTGNYYDFNATPTFATTDTNAQTISNAVMFRAAPILSVFAAGSLTITALSELRADAFTVPNLATITTLRQFESGVVTVASGATVSTLVGLDLGGPVATGTITNRYGIRVATGSGAGTFTTENGIRIEALSGGATTTGLLVVAPGGATTAIGVDIQAPNGAGTNIGLRNKGSTQLGSSAQLTVDTSGNFATSGTLSVTGHATLEGVTSTGATGTGKFVFDASPTVTGTLTAAALTATGALTQGSSGQLTSDASGNFTTSGSISTGGTFIGGTVVDTMSAASSTIGITSLVRRLNNTSGGALTVTAAPTIADGAAGQIMIILNASTNNVVLQDQGTLASSNLRLGASTRTLGTRDSLILLYSATVGDWVELTFNNVI